MVNMSNLYMPFCSLLLSTFMVILFFAKVRKFQNTENEYFFLMLIDCFLSTVFCMIAIYLIYCHKSSSYLVTLSNRLECFTIFNFAKISSSNLVKEMKFKIIFKNKFLKFFIISSI